MLIIIISNNNNINANTIKVDSLLFFLKNSKIQDDKIITDSLSMDNMEFSDLFKVSNILHKKSNFEFRLYYSEKELFKILIINNKLKIEKHFFVINFNGIKILLSDCKNFFIIPQNDFYIFCSVYENKSNDFSLKELVSVDSQFNPVNKMYLNKDIMLAKSSFKRTKNKTFEEIIIYLQDYGRCINIKDKNINFINDFFKEKGVFSCSGFFKKFKIELEENHKDHYGMFWFLGNYSQAQLCED